MTLSDVVGSRPLSSLTIPSCYDGGKELVSELHEPLPCRVGGREIHVTIPETGLTHRIRALFENAIRSDNGSQCPLLWRMYLKFLVRKHFGFLFSFWQSSAFSFKSEKVLPPGWERWEGLIFILTRYWHLLSIRKPDGIMSGFSGLGNGVQVAYLLKILDNLSEIKE